MEVELSNTNPTKQFGCFEINWKIHHYFVATLRPWCSIASPEFSVTGFQTTKWQLILFPYMEVDGIKRIEVELKRLCIIPGAKVIWADWKVFLKDSKGSNLCVKGDQSFIEENSAKITFDIFRETFEVLLPFDSDTLQVHCQLIVSHREANNKVIKSSDVGLKSLSQDLLALYKRGRYSDIEIRINGKVIRAHKTILQSRSPFFKSLIEENPEKGAFDLNESLNYETVDKMLSYLYSGKLEFVLGKPTVLMYDCAMYLEIREVQQYYVFNYLSLDSKVDVDEIVDVWHITNFKTRVKDCLQSQSLIGRVSKTILRLSLCLKSEDGNNSFLCFSTHHLQRNIQERVCLELWLLARDKKLITRKEINVKNDTLELARLDYKMLENSFLADDTLNIDIKVRICSIENTWKIFGIPSTNNSVTPNEWEHSYVNLSNDIESLFTYGNVRTHHKDTRKNTFNDSCLAFDNLNFPVHKCILAARSREIPKKIEEMRGDLRNPTNLGISPDISSIFLRYLYSGRLKNYKQSHIAEISDAAKEFVIPSLEIICSQILENNATVQNVSDV